MACGKVRSGWADSGTVSRQGSSAFTTRDALLLLLLALFWGNSFLFVKLAVDVIPPTWIVAGRLTIGGILVSLIVVARARLRGDNDLRLPRGWRALGALLLIGSFGSGLPWALQAWGQQYLDSGLMAVLNSTTPAATLALAVAAGQERLYRSRVLGLLIAILGSVIIVGGEVQAGGPILALLAAVGSTVGYGFGTVMTRAAVSGRFRPLPATAVQLVLGAGVLTMLALGTSGPPPPAWDLPLVPVLALSALGLLGTGLAFLIYFTLIERVGATNASMVTYIVPVVGLISGALVRGERFGANVLIGAVVLIGGVWLAQRTDPMLVPEQGAGAVPEASLSGQR
ncbi:Permease of the drug/metabolite transporter (DMT) superfamily [Euzebya pacifica]|uniref:Permease of the drug/metabolite transporter (DMT) superfamily n=1 Tax=Euzebya pacifica TaxID=1608957 RepID=A0A346Y070_9ACTN|nr:Permease of the drug/metabolite transporter (DMT) superfamily [Euzebya pacifica]